MNTIHNGPSEVIEVTEEDIIYIQELRDSR